MQACLEGPTSALPTEAKGPIVLERGGAENLGLPVDGLARLRLEHNGTAPRGVSKSFARRKDTCNILSYLRRCLVSAVFTPCAKNFLLA